MHLRISLLLMSFGFSFWSFGQVIIKGTFPGAENHEINIHSPADLVSLKQEQLGSCLVDDTSGFMVNIAVNNRTAVYIEIGYYTFKFYAIPGRQYFLVSDTLKFNNVYRPFYNKEPLPCLLTEKPESGTNKALYSIDSDFDDFILANFSGIYQNRRAGLFTPFKQQIKQKLDSLNDPFLQAYADYKMASAEWAIIPQKKAWFYITYIKDKPILYHNQEYMKFIESFYQDIPLLNNKFVSRTDLIEGINNADSYTVLLDKLGKDSLLLNEQIRELVMFFTLKQLYGNPAYSKTQINKFLDQLSLKSKFEEHREIANNLKIELNDMQKGSRAKDFQLLSLSGDTVSLEKFKGKQVYIGFFTTWSYACLAEFEGMKRLFENYGERVNFISIILDDNIEVAKQLKQEKNYSWTFLYNGTHYTLLNDYRVKTFPSFILLDQDLNIFQYPAYKPSEVIEEELKRLLTSPNE